MKTMTRNNRQQGLTLIEIMVALVISLFLLAGLLQLFIGTRQSARIQENLSRVQENGRYAVDYLGRVIRLAGYRSKETIKQGDSFEERFTGSYAIKDNSSESKSPVIVFEGENTGEGEVRDCLNQLITSLPGTPVLATNTLKITDTTLQCQTSPTKIETVVDGVEDMYVLYGENTDGDLLGVADRYVSGPFVSDWKKVVSVRVSFLLQTLENNLAESPQPYTFKGVSTTPTDRRLRRVFTTTITLRNRV
jgi:type IV pilus assembly protein PilW